MITSLGAGPGRVEGGLKQNDQDLITMSSINICNTKDLFFTFFFLNKEIISKKYHKAFPFSVQSRRREAAYKVFWF